MASAAPLSPAPGIFDVPVPGNWVLPGDQFWLALIKPPFTGPQPILDDTPRPQALALARALFARNAAGEFPITLGAAGRTAMVIFPEFAFATSDFAAVDALIREQTQPVITLAGFGAVRGNELRAFLEAGHALCGWHAGLSGIDTTKRYNGAWCWIHDPRQPEGSRHRCYVLLKNWPDQREERINIPDIAMGMDAVRLILDDCFIYPLICADILCTDGNGPHERVAASIRSNVAARKPVLVPVMMLERRPSHGAWRARIADMINTANLLVSVVTCNHVEVAPIGPEEDDQVRCFSGALVGNAQFSPDHREVPHPVRPLRLGEISGYVVRSTAPGIVSGAFIWREAGLVNRFIWLPNTRTTLVGGDLITAIDSPVLVETVRWCARVGRPAWLAANSPGEAYLKSGYDSMRCVLKQTGTNSAVWPGVLTGRGLAESSDISVDRAGSEQSLRDALNEAYLAFASIVQTTEFKFEPNQRPVHFVRAAAGERQARDIVIWSSPDRLCEHQRQMLEDAALNRRFENTVVVVGRGAGGAPSAFCGLRPSNTTDVSVGPPADDSDITETVPAKVFWMPLTEFHGLIARESWGQVPEARRQNAIAQAVEALLNRNAA